MELFQQKFNNKRIRRIWSLISCICIFGIIIQAQTYFFSEILDKRDNSNGCLEYCNPDYAAPPIINTLSPNHGPTPKHSFEYTTQISGSHLDNKSLPLEVYFNTTLANISSYNSAEIIVYVPIAEGMANVWVVVDGTKSNNLTFTYDEPPVLSKITPDNGTRDGGYNATISGTFITNGASYIVRFGGLIASIKEHNATDIVVTVPTAFETGYVDVSVEIDGQISNFLSFHNIGPVPMITSISPTHGPTNGGTPITISGSNFGPLNLCDVYFNETEVTIQFHSETEIVFFTPEGVGLEIEIIVSVDGQNGSGVEKFNYNPPTITSLSPTHGPTKGETTMEIIGTDFGQSGSCVVFFNSSIVPWLNRSHTSINFTVPNGVGIEHEIYVEIEGQRSNNKTFSYDAPVINGINPPDGPAHGGIAIEITGQNFGTTGSCIVYFDNEMVSTFIRSDTSINFTLPAGVGSNCEVWVEIEGQSSNIVYFKYSNPTITLITPDHGTTAGGTAIELQGQDFGTIGSCEVFFGLISATVLNRSDTSINFTLPAGVGLGHQVHVEIEGQSSNNVLFDYDPPSITTISPDHGPTGGGTTITIEGQNFGTTGTCRVHFNSSLAPIIQREHNQINITDRKSVV